MEDIDDQGDESTPVDKCNRIESEEFVEQMMRFEV